MKLNFSSFKIVKILVIVIILTIGVCVVLMSLRNKETMFELPFQNIKSNEINAEELTQTILQTIGYPEAEPIVTYGDSFWAVLSNDPDIPDKDLRLYRLAASFIISIPGEKENRILSYELRTEWDQNLLIVYRDEVKINGQPYEVSHPTTGYKLKDLFSGIRDFPASEYRNLTTYGEEDVDLYELQLNTGGPLSEESFFYNKYGATFNNERSIPFLILHNKWGEQINDSEEEFDRYSNFGGKGRGNLYYDPVN